MSPHPADLARMRSEVAALSDVVTARFNALLTAQRSAGGTLPPGLSKAAAEIRRVHEEVGRFLAAPQADPVADARIMATLVDVQRRTLALLADMERVQVEPLRDAAPPQALPLMPWQDAPPARQATAPAPQMPVPRPVATPPQQGPLDPAPFTSIPVPAHHAALQAGQQQAGPAGVPRTGPPTAQPRPPAAPPQPAFQAIPAQQQPTQTRPLQTQPRTQQPPGAFPFPPQPPVAPAQSMPAQAMPTGSPTGRMAQAAPTSLPPQPSLGPAPSLAAPAGPAPQRQAAQPNLPPQAQPQPAPTFDPVRQGYGNLVRSEAHDDHGHDDDVAPAPRRRRMSWRAGVLLATAVLAVAASAGIYLAGPRLGRVVALVRGVPTKQQAAKPQERKPPTGPIPAAVKGDTGAAPRGDATAMYVPMLATYGDYSAAREAFVTLKQRYPELLAGTAPDIETVTVPDGGTWHRLGVLPALPRDQAQSLCQQLQAAGHQGCWLRPQG